MIHTLKESVDKEMILTGRESDDMEMIHIANAATRNLVGRISDMDEAAGIAAIETHMAIETTASIAERRSAIDATEP